MKQRCGNRKNKSFKNYGGRGITVCDRWQKFENFLKDMGSRPSNAHSLDRINNNLGYELSNCRWATWIEQANNRRPPIEIQAKALKKKQLVKKLYSEGMGHIAIVRETGLPYCTVQGYMKDLNLVGPCNRGKLNASKVRAIRKAYKVLTPDNGYTNAREISEKYGVHVSMIHAIHRGAVWSHIK